MSAREELRRQRRKSKVSKAAVAVADNVLADLQKVLGTGHDRPGDHHLLLERKTLEKENNLLQTELQVAAVAALGTSVPVGLPAPKVLRMTPVPSPRPPQSSTTTTTNNNSTTTTNTDHPVPPPFRPSSTGSAVQLRDAAVTFSSKPHDGPTAAPPPPGFSPWSNHHTGTGATPQHHSMTQPVQVKQFKQTSKRKKSKTIKAPKPTKTKKTPPSKQPTTAAGLAPPLLRTTNRDPWTQFSKPKTTTKEEVISKWRAQTDKQTLPGVKPLGADGPELVVRVICAEDVLALDRLTGKSDPVAFVFCGKESALSHIKTGTCNPYWNQEFRFGGATQNIQQVDELHIQIKDDDGVSQEAVAVRGRTTQLTQKGQKGGRVKMKRLYDNLGGVTVDLQPLRNSGTKWR